MDYRELTDRQKDLYLHVPPTVTVAGVGGIGSWVALFLENVGTREFYIFDPDIIESHNLNRTPYLENQVGQYKVEALKRLMIAKNRDIKVFSFKTKFDPDILLDTPTVVIDCTDDYKSQIKINKYCKDKGIEYYRVGTREHHITVTNTVPKWSTTDEQEEGTCGVTIPQWIAPQAMAASIVVSKICTGKPSVNIAFDIRKVRRRWVMNKDKFDKKIYKISHKLRKNSKDKIIRSADIKRLIEKELPQFKDIAEEILHELENLLLFEGYAINTYKEVDNG